MMREIEAFGTSAEFGLRALEQAEISARASAARLRAAASRLTLESMGLDCDADRIRGQADVLRLAIGRATAAYHAHRIP